MNVEVIGSRIQVEGRSIPPRLGNVLRLLIAATGGDPGAGIHAAVSTSALAGLIGKSTGTVNAYVGTLRNTVGNDAIVKTANLNTGYWFDLQEHQVDAFEAQGAIESWERRISPYTWTNLPPEHAASAVAELGSLSASWLENPFKSCEEMQAGRSLIETFNGLRQSLTHILSTSLLAIGDRASARAARVLLERPTYRFRRELATGSEIDLFEDSELPPEDFVAEFPKPETWTLLALSYYRDDLPARAFALLDAIEERYDTAHGENLPPVLADLRRRMKKSDPTLDVRSVTEQQAEAFNSDPHDDDQATEDPQALGKYLGRVRHFNDRLRFGDPTRQSLSSDEGGPTGRMSLKSVYTPLRVSLTSTGTSERVTEDATTVLDALERPEYRAVVLLGEPGGGKSTVVSYLATTLATKILDTEVGDGDTSIPVHVRLPDVSQPTRGLDAIWEGVHETFADPADPQPVPDLVRQLRSKIELGEVVFLLDGLDEVPDEHVGDIVELITKLRDQYGACQYITTCRTYDYSLPEPSRRLPFPSLFLLRFSLREQLEYVDRWYTALAHVQTHARVAERKANLKETLKADERLSELGEIPLLLTLMALVHTNEGELPRSRSVLYHRAVSYLLAETPQWRRQSDGAVLATHDMIAIGARVAHQMHLSEEGVGRGKFRGLSIAEIDTVVADFFELEEESDPRQYAELRKKIEIHRSRLLHSHGLLLDQGGGRFAFAHRSIQEFLAGLYYLNGGDPDTSAVAVRPHWREPFLLMAGYGAHEGEAMYFIVTLIVELANAQTTDGTLIAAEMLAAVGRLSLRAKGYKHVLKEADGAGQPGLWPRLTRALLEIGTDPQTDVVTRVRALVSVGALGDARIVDDMMDIRNLSDRTVLIPEGPRRVGRQAPSTAAAAAKSQNASPERVLDHQPFQVGIFPVTNVEYEAFIAANGYRDLVLWKSPEGRAWATGDADFAHHLFEVASATALRDFRKELDEGVYASMEELHKEIKRMCASRTEPFYWRNPRFRSSNQPVVGVNWWEAQAYTAWLTVEGHSAGWLADTQEVRLPTEWEWERTARHSNDARFPWGDDQLLPERAHTRFDELSLNRATPVGAFPGGASEAGALDLTGNVWEWTLSRNVSYEPLEDDVRDDTSGVHERVVRGGSWYANDPATLEASFRGFDYPMNVYFDLGFRVVIDKTRV